MDVCVYVYVYVVWKERERERERLCVYTSETKRERGGRRGESDGDDGRIDAGTPAGLERAAGA